MPGKKYPCLRCRENTSGKKSVECSLCNQWVHTACEKIDDALFKALELAQKSNIAMKWTCTSCNTFASKINKTLVEHDARITRVEDQTADNAADIEDLS